MNLQMSKKKKKNVLTETLWSRDFQVVAPLTLDSSHLQVRVIPKDRWTRGRRLQAGELGGLTRLGDIPWQQRSPEVRCCGGEPIQGGAIFFCFVYQLEMLAVSSAVAAVRWSWNSGEVAWARWRWLVFVLIWMNDGCGNSVEFWSGLFRVCELCDFG